MQVMFVLVIWFQVNGIENGEVLSEHQTLDGCQNAMVETRKVNQGNDVVIYCQQEPMK